MSLHFELVTPARLVRSEEVHMVVVPGTDGEFGVLEGHAPFMSTVKDGTIKVYKSAGSAPEEIMSKADLPQPTCKRAGPQGPALFVCAMSKRNHTRHIQNFLSSAFRTFQARENMTWQIHIREIASGEPRNHVPDPRTGHPERR
jgi:F-type H+-transporting ATPase subunit epsilon